MSDASSSHWWLARFAIRWLQLEPEAGAHRAIRRAVAAYDRATFLAPQEAADVCHYEAQRRMQRDAATRSLAARAMAMGDAR